MVAVAWRSAERDHYVHHAILENLRISRRALEPHAGAALISALTSPREGRCHSLLSLAVSLVLELTLRPFATAESSLKLRGIIGSDVSPGRPGSFSATTTVTLFIVPGLSSRSDRPPNERSKPGNQSPTPSPEFSSVRCPLPSLPKSLLTGAFRRGRRGTGKDGASWRRVS
ncbi:hypothetical protein X777_08327 [Ooceraea biroi]|uniref:Uncharacterized protein n=1 Tax=Ooceraea biroi TaxID=2015173 RepID=A0A026WYK9_OOCBI|nr:hypothetical protein X777_08327 [Ooceraea biroi]